MSLPLPAGFLLLPAASDRSFARLRRKLRLLALRRLLSHPLSGLPTPALRSALAGLRPPLLDLAKRRSGVLLAALGTPDVLTALLLWEREMFPGGELLEALAPDLLAALPPEQLLETLRWEHPVDAVRAPRLGLALRFDPPAQAMMADPTGLSFLLADGSTWRPKDPPREGVSVSRPYHPLHPELPRLHLATLDTNRLSMMEDHPDKEGNAISLGGRPAEEWAATLREALDAIRVGLPEWWREAGLSLERLLPVGYQPEQHLSASYQEAPGMAYLTLHPDVLTMAEAVVHETQHGRLNTLMWMDPVLRNGRSAWTASPVRPDLRPLSGVLLAAHAFTPVAALHARLADAGHPLARSPVFARRRQEVLDSNARGLAVLEEMSEPTPRRSAPPR